MLSLSRAARPVAAALVVMTSFAAANVVRAAGPAERSLPATTVAYIKVENVVELREGFKASQFGRLLADPAMKALKESILDKLDEANKSARAEVGLSIGELLDLPQGAVSIAVVATQGGPRPVDFLVTADAGKNAKPMADLLAKLTDKARNGGKAQVKTEEFKGATLTSIQGPDKGDDAKGGDTPMVWSQQGNVFQFATSAAALKDFLAHADGREDALAANKSFQAVLKKSGNDGQVLWYLDIDQAMKLLTQALADQGQNAAQVEAQIELVGLNGLKAVGGRFGLNVGGYDSLSKIYLHVPGDQVQGLLKLFVNPPIDLRPQSWVPANVASYQSMSWDLDKMYVALNDLADMLAPGMLANVEQQLAGPQGDGLSFQKDLFAPLGNRITFITDFKKPVKEDSQRMLAAVALDDAKLFQNTLNKVFKLANITPKQREFQGATVYDFEVPEVAPGANLPQSMSLTIAKDHLFAGDQGLLEQVLRSGGPGLADNPTFQALTKHYPAKSFSLSYQRPDEVARVYYDMIKTGQFKEMVQQQAREAGQPIPDVEIIDPKLLPDYSVFTKYLTQTGGYGQSDEDGAVFTSFTLKPNTP